MSSKLTLSQRWYTRITAIRLNGRQLAIIASIALVGLAVTHVDLRQALTNPIVLLIGGIIIGLHALGALIMMLITRIARKRRNG